MAIELNFDLGNLVRLCLVIKSENNLMVERSPSMRSPDFNTQEYDTTPHKFTHVREQISDIITALVSSRVLGTDHMTAKERLENSLSSRVVKTCFI